MSKNERTRLWLDRLRRQAASQLTIADFCRLDQISEAAFYKWKSRLAPSGAPSGDSASSVDSDPKRRQGNPEAPHSFTELMDQSTNTPHSNIPTQATLSAHATLPGGIMITLGTQPEVAGMIVDRLLQHVLPAATKQVR